MEMFAMPITPVPDKVYKLPHDMQRQGHEFWSADVFRLCVTHDCSDEAAGLDIKGAAYSMSLAHKQVYIQRTFCTSFPNFDFS
jgi:hypothetical protein